MILWQLFFKDIKNVGPSSMSKTIGASKKTQDILVVRDFQHGGESGDIYLSMGNEINLYDLEELCDSVGWVRRPLKKVKMAIDHSFITISMFQKKRNVNKMIGFARATSDYAFNATIWDVVIHPEFQGRGLGKTLMDQVIQQLRCADISTITLFADPQVVSFYKNLGFIKDPDGVKGMFWYPR